MYLLKNGIDNWFRNYDGKKNRTTSSSLLLYKFYVQFNVAQVTVYKLNVYIIILLK